MECPRREMILEFGFPSQQIILFRCAITKYKDKSEHLIREFRPVSKKFLRIWLHDRSQTLPCAIVSRISRVEIKNFDRTKPKFATFGPNHGGP